MKIDVKEIEKLLKLLENSGVSEIEIKQGEESVRISTQANMAYASYAMPAPQQHITMPQPAASTADASQATATASKEVLGHQVKSPMVGTFYNRPSPESSPFVTVGQRVKKGEPLCIIEAMKMMNRIEADANGVVKAILIENGFPVEFDQPLFVIEID
jgi:acetyl-CoA carboxylase biotin carboxyl carrier protein